MKDLSVIIVNYNVKHFLEQCLHSVYKASENIETEVFVIDNNSSDGSAGFIKNKFPEVIYIENHENVGFSKANNQGIRMSEGKYILLLNPDTIVEEDTFTKVISFMEKHPIAGGLGVKMIDGKGMFLPESKRGLPTPWVAFYKMFGLSALFPKSRRFGKYHLSYLSENEIHEVEILAGAFMLLRKDVLVKTGLLDEDFFMYGEDIDLSYRILKSGYRNYYFPETTIIHYKGESTKKGSLNYVRVFFNAMIIFARKHFSHGNAGIFSLLIHFAIWFRAIISVIKRVTDNLIFPLSDSLVIFCGYLILTPFWEKLIYEKGYYPPEFLNYVVPIYITIWISAIFFSGGYKKPIDLYKVARGLLWGTIAILLIYSLVDESYRFSRALILLGFFWSLLFLLIYRLIFHFLKPGIFRIDLKKIKRIAIVGDNIEALRVKKLLENTQIKLDFAGFIAMNEKDNTIENIGNIEQISEIVRINRIDELIFCAENIPSAEIIRLMLKLSDLDVDYKIAPPESISIIGSNSIHTAGELYIVQVNAISRPVNLKRKRFIDVLISIFFILVAPVFIWFVNEKSGFINNCYRIIAGKATWVGYSPEPETYNGLPEIKKGILYASDLFAGVTLDLVKKKNINTLYARDYHIFTDFEIILKNLKSTGRKLTNL